MMTTAEYDLEVIPGKLPQVIHVSQCDTGTRTIIFNLFARDGTLSIPSGTLAGVRGTRSDGGTFDKPATRDGSKVSFVVTDDMTGAAGKAVCEIYLYTTTPERELSTENFILKVEGGTIAG